MTDKKIAWNLAEDIRSYISNPDAEQVEGLFLRIFEYQWRFNRTYRAYCDRRNLSPDNILRWQDIPPAPAAAFKRFELRCSPLEDAAIANGGITFDSSGTSQSETSRHYMDAPALSVYRTSLRGGYRKYVLTDLESPEILALMPTLTAESPFSSLSFMLEELIHDYGGAFLTGMGWQEKLRNSLRGRTEPVVLFGTAFAFLHFFDFSDEQFSLPTGSRIVETGGFKGKSREVSREELYSLFTERLGIPATHCISEYGMSELASQYYESTFYDFTRDVSRVSRKVASPTLRTRIVNPVTNHDVAPGEAGLLVHYDVCNLNSVVAIQTEDMGIWADDKKDGFHLLGRAPGAVLRGCSLTAEEMGNALKNSRTAT